MNSSTRAINHDCHLYKGQKYCLRFQENVIFLSIVHSIDTGRTIRMSKFPVNIFPSRIFKCYPQKQSSPAIPRKFGNLFDQQFAVILKVLNYIGNIPAFYCEDDRKYKLFYSFKTTFIPLISAICAILFWTFYLCELILKIELIPFWILNPERSSLRHLLQGQAVENQTRTAVYTSLQIIYTLYPILQLANIYAGWRHSSRLIIFLNNWTLFCGEFGRIFNPKIRAINDNPRAQAHSLLIFYVVLPSIGGYLLTVLLCWAGSANWSQFIFTSVFSFRMLTPELTEDVIHILCYKMIAGHFDMIHRGISAVVLWGNITEKDVRNWRKLLEDVREQCKLISEYQKPTQLLFIAKTIVTSTLWLFALLNIPPNTAPVLLFHVASGGYACLQILRLYAKTLHADNVTEEEQRIANLLSTINTEELEQSAILQVKFTHDLLIFSPARILLGNVVHFNKGLLLSVFNQVVTYLIVLMQFVQK